jgi:hypothetical protein
MGLKRGGIGNTLGEHIGNLKGTCWEERKKEKSPPPPPAPNPKLERKKIKAPWVHASAYPLAAFIFSFQNYWSPFLA